MVLPSLRLPGTAPKYAGKDQVNPGSSILSGEMMLRCLGWSEAADLVIKGMNGAIGQKQVTYDFERLMEGASLLKYMSLESDDREYMSFAACSDQAACRGAFFIFTIR